MKDRNWFDVLALALIPIISVAAEVSTHRIDSKTANLEQHYTACVSSGEGRSETSSEPSACPK